jgi:hypothetical protein
MTGRSPVEAAIRGHQLFGNPENTEQIANAVHGTMRPAKFFQAVSFCSIATTPFRLSGLKIQEKKTICRNRRRNTFKKKERSENV